MRIMNRKKKSWKNASLIKDFKSDVSMSSVNVDHAQDLWKKFFLIYLIDRLTHLCPRLLGLFYIKTTPLKHQLQFGDRMGAAIPFLPSLRLTRVAKEAGEVVQPFFRTQTEVRAFAAARGKPAHVHNPS